jgi:hypothetical protein
MSSPRRWTKVEAFLRFRALLAQVLAFGRRQLRQEIVEAFITVIEPVELLVGPAQHAVQHQGLGVFLLREIYVQRRELVLLGEADGAAQEGP